MDREWLTIEDLIDYLHITKNEVEKLMLSKRIPFYDSPLGTPRFYKREVDLWVMGKPIHHEDNSLLKQTRNTTASQFTYRGRLITSYILTATQVLMGNKPLMELPGFIKKAVQKINDSKKEFLMREEFAFINNFYDYLRISCQLGLFEVRKTQGKQKFYYKTPFAIEIYREEDENKIKDIILRSILDTVASNQETSPKQEKHAVLLLYYYLSLKHSGTEPRENYFLKDTDKEGSYFPRIRFYFAKSLSKFLLNDDMEKERKFLEEWNALIQYNCVN